MKRSLIIFLLTLFNVLRMDAYEVGIVSMFRNEAFYLKEWIEYNRMIGVDHFWLYNDRSTDHWEEVLEPYIKEGVVEIITWPSPENATHEQYCATQVAAFKNGALNARGKAKWVAFIDVDEFILPMRDKTLPECLEKHFSDALAIYINWRNFGTGGVNITPGEPILFRLTACSISGHPNNNIGKSLVRPDLVKAEDLWHPHHFPMQPGLNYFNGDGGVIVFDGNDLKPDAKSHTRFLRINHYCLRDESYYKNVKLPRAKWMVNKELLIEHYNSFSLIKDFAMVSFIKNSHPEMFEKFWKEYQ